MSDIFQLFADDKYQFGACSVRVYDRKDIASYGDNFLHELYECCISSAPSRPHGILPESFPGLLDLSADAICAFLHTRNPLLLMCVDKDEPDTDGAEFDVIGFSYPVIWTGPSTNSIPANTPDPGRSLIKGYAFFRPAWRTPELSVCMMLSGIYFFHTYNLLTIHGQSIPSNHLTRKFLAQFGVKTVGTLPKFIYDGKQMVDSVQSCLTREDFEAYVRQVLVDCSTV